jgi:3-phosphoshikimate 1-carboxyvinyltransferase
VTPAASTFVAGPGGRVAGDCTVPGDKSISHRAAMLGAIARGETEIRGFLEAQDCLATLAALEALGARIERPSPSRVVIHGEGPGILRAPEAPLDLGNSATSMRLLTGLLCGLSLDATLVGDDSLMRRPMERVAAPLRRMGADIRTRDGQPPIVIHGGRELSGCEHRLEFPSAQIKSAILLAGLRAKGVTSVREPASSRDHTEMMLPAFGVRVAHEKGAVTIEGPAQPTAARIDVPGDFSSAAFLIVAALIAGTGTLVVRGVGVNPTRTALIGVLRKMGADIRLHARPTAGAEPVADIEVRPGKLHGITVPASCVPVAIDELPILFAAAAVAEGETVVTGAAELRVKESDRLAAMAAGLAAVGIEVEMRPDGLRVRGGEVSGGTVESHGDHRIAMTFAVLAARARSAIVVRGAQNVATSFPGFVQAARAAGLRLEETT